MMINFGLTHRTDSKGNHLVYASSFSLGPFLADVIVQLVDVWLYMSYMFLFFWGGGGGGFIHSYRFLLNFRLALPLCRDLNVLVL